MTDSIDMSTLDPNEIIVGAGGETLAQAAAAEQGPPQWPELPATVTVVRNHPCTNNEYGWECEGCGATSEHFHAPQREAWAAAAAHRCPVSATATVVYVGGYQVRPRPCGATPPGATRSPSGYIVLADGTPSSYYGSDVKAELLALAAERGRGETLDVDGDVWGGARVVVSHPRTREHGFLAVSFDDSRYPALSEACLVRSPNDDDEDSVDRYGDGPNRPGVMA